MSIDDSREQDDTGDEAKARRKPPCGTRSSKAFPPHLVAGSIMVAVMGVMFAVHEMTGKDKPHDALEELKLRFARGEISREEYEERHRILTTT